MLLREVLKPRSVWPFVGLVAASLGLAALYTVVVFSVVVP